MSSILKGLRGVPGKYALSWEREHRDRADVRGTREAVEACWDGSRRANANTCTVAPLRCADPHATQRHTDTPTSSMLKHSNAYVVWRKQSQQMLDFAVLVTSAAPQLQHALDAHAADPTVHIAANVSFRPSKDPYSTEKRTLKGYTTVLGATLLLSVFSYFEAYFFSLVDEVFAFHGGEKGIERVIARQLAPRTPSSQAKAALNFLRTNYDPDRADRYRKHTRPLRGEPILWPSQRLMLYGLRQAIAQRKRWKAVDIPDVLTSFLTFPITQEERDRFHTIRDQRNHIAHGRVLTHELRRAVVASNFLRELSMRIDAHVVDSYFIIERYAH